MWARFLEAVAAFDSESACAIQLREKELALFDDNFNAVGTQSAVLAGFAMTSFAEIDLPHNTFYAQKACTYV